jgi:hypothetical protein
MIIKTINIIIIVLAGLLISCTDSQNEDNRSLDKSLVDMNITEVQRFGNHSDIVIGNMGIVEVDQYDRVFIAENSVGSRTVHVFSPDGRYVTNIGSEGNGPGEFRTLGHLIANSGTIYLFDRMNNKLLSFTENESDTKYQLTDEIRLSKSALSSDKAIEGESLEELFVLDNGSFLVGYEDAKTPNIDDRRIHYYLTDNEGELIEDAVQFSQNAETIFNAQVGNSSITMELPFLNRPLIAISEGGIIYLAESDNFEISVVNMDGDSVRSISIDVEPAPLNKDDVLKWYEGNEVFYSAIQKAPFPEYWPVLNNFIMDDENRVWVSTIVENFDIHEWWVLDEIGEPITKFEWPRQEPIEVVHNGFMYARQTDEETGVQEIVKYRIEFMEAK